MLASLTKRVRFIAQSAALVCLTIVILLATLTFTPIRTGASVSLMSCCNGMAGHCDMGMMSKEAPPPEPMCGLDAKSAVDQITIVAEPTTSSKEGTTASFTAPCGTECCSQIWAGYRRPNRDFNYLIQRGTVEQNHRESLRRYASPAHLFTSAHFNKTVPRGPPSVNHC